MTQFPCACAGAGAVAVVATSAVHSKANFKLFEAALDIVSSRLCFVETFQIQRFRPYRVGKGAAERQLLWHIIRRLCPPNEPRHFKPNLSAPAAPSARVPACPAR